MTCRVSWEQHLTETLLYRHHLIFFSPQTQFYSVPQAIEKQFNSVTDEEKRDYLDVLFDRDVAACQNESTVAAHGDPTGSVW